MTLTIPSFRVINRLIPVETYSVLEMDRTEEYRKLSAVIQFMFLRPMELCEPCS